MTTQPLDFGSSLLVTVIGMAIVLFGLSVLIFLIKALVKVTQNLGQKKEPAQAAPAVPVAAVSEPVEETEENEDELIAVITAAIACMMEDGTAFKVRHVKRVNTAPAWQKAGREEQIYSRY
ncbi:MAG: OadG family protein [Clostridiales bacterium]|nr:OadG family protein [Clostridia bacterium]MCR4882423.1 OadG family protein [Clostridiales bacterium]